MVLLFDFRNGPPKVCLLLVPSALSFFTMFFFSEHRSTQSARRCSPAQTSVHTCSHRLFLFSKSSSFVDPALDLSALHNSHPITHPQPAPSSYIPPPAGVEGLLRELQSRPSTLTSAPSAPSYSTSTTISTSSSASFWNSVSIHHVFFIIFSRIFSSSGAG